MRPREFYGLEDELTEETDEMVRILQEEFSHWISTVSYPKIKKFRYSHKKLKFDSKAIFLSFNYTNTLEVLYNIPQSYITYIHGNAKESYENLIFGHGVESEGIPALSELDADGHSNRSFFSDAEDAARYPFYAFKKDTKKVIEDNLAFFNNCKQIDEVFVLGHSLGDVDLPYFKEIFKRCPKAEWHYAYCSDVNR